MVGNADEAAYAAAACHYPPRGNRSVGPVRGVQARSSHRLEGLDDVACVVMVETAEGIRNVAIAATPGVDCIYVGPGDLAIGLGLSAWGEDWTREEASLHAEAIPDRRGLSSPRRHARHAHRRRGDRESLPRAGLQDDHRRQRPGPAALRRSDELAVARGEREAIAEPETVAVPSLRRLAPMCRPRAAPSRSVPEP